MSLRKKTEENIPAEIRMISGCKDKQTSADDDVASFGLPNPAGRRGGACTSALLNILYKDKKKPDDDISFKDVLSKMRVLLSEMSYEQIPQLTASRPLNVDTKFDITPDNFNGTKRAVLIGINYVGQPDNELGGCHNDVLNIKEYLMNVHDFKEENIQLLLDDDKNINPTKKNMMNAYKIIASQSDAGDVIYLHYSGHGSHKRDYSKDETDKQDETLVPVDYFRSGDISDDMLYKKLVTKIKKGVFVTSVMDCCHSGTILDLPYQFKATDKGNEMNGNDEFNFDKKESKVLITAALINPDGKDKGNEWVTIANYSPNTVDLNGWSLSDTKRTPYKLSGSLLSGESVRLNPLKIDDGEIRLSNKEGNMILNSDGEEIDSVSWDGCKSGEVTVFYTTTPSPLQEFSQVFIAAALVNPDGKDKDNEWVALVNYSSNNINLDGWTLSDTKRTPYKLSGSLISGESIRLNPLKSDDGAIQLSNKRGDLILKAADGKEIDSVSWDEPESGEVIVFEKNDREILQQPKRIRL